MSRPFRKRRPTEAELERMRRAIEAGVNGSTFSSRFGWSTTDVKRWLGMLGQKPRRELG